VTLKTARDYFKNRRIISVIEPYRYSRVKNLHKEYSESFELSDIIILLPIDPADETDTYGANIEMILEEAEKRYNNKGYSILIKKCYSILEGEIKKMMLLFYGSW